MASVLPTDSEFSASSKGPSYYNLTLPLPHSSRVSSPFRGVGMPGRLKVGSLLCMLLPSISRLGSDTYCGFYFCFLFFFFKWFWGLDPGPRICNASTLPLDHICSLRSTRHFYIKAAGHSWATTVHDYVSVLKKSNEKLPRMLPLERASFCSCGAAGCSHRHGLALDRCVNVYRVFYIEQGR